MGLSPDDLGFLIRRVVRRAYILAGAQCAALLFVGCIFSALSRRESQLLLLSAMAVGFSIAFFQLWGAGALAALAGERRFKDATGWLRQFRGLSLLLVVLHVGGALRGWATQTDFVPWFRTGSAVIRLLLAVFWLAQGLDAHRVLSRSTQERPTGSTPSPSQGLRFLGLHLCCLLLGALGALAVSQLSQLHDQRIGHALPTLTFLFWAMALALHRRFSLGAVAWLVFAAGLMGFVGTPGAAVHIALRVDLSGSPSETVMEARLLEVLVVQSLAQAAKFALILASLFMRTRERVYLTNSASVRWLTALVAFVVASGFWYWVLKHPQNPNQHPILLTFAAALGLSFITALAIGKHYTPWERGMILGSLAFVCLLWALEIKWLAMMSERWHGMKDLLLSWGLHCLSLLPLLALVLTALRKPQETSQDESSASALVESQ